MSESLPEPLRPKRLSALWTALTVGGVVLARTLLVNFEPLIRGYSPGCYFHRLTGLHCPGCGGTRAFFAFLKGDLALSWRMNPLFLIGLVAGGMLVAATLYGRMTGRQVGWAWVSAKAGWTIFGLVLVFWVIRNIPHWPFTLLAPY